MASKNGDEDEGQALKPPPPLTDEQQEYVEAALRAGTQSLGEITSILAIAEARGIPPMEMQRRWMDYKIGVLQTKQAIAANLGIIVT